MCVLLHLLICTALRAHIIVVEALYKIHYYYILLIKHAKQFLKRGTCEVLNLVLKIFPRFLRRSRGESTGGCVLAFMHKDFILLILQSERGQFFHKRGFRPSTCTHATLFMLSNITETHSYPQMPDC